MEYLEGRQSILAAPEARQRRFRVTLVAHGATHGGVLAVISSKPRTTPEQLAELLDRLKEPPLLIEGIEDARNLGFVIRTADREGTSA